MADNEKKHVRKEYSEAAAAAPAASENAGVSPDTKKDMTASEQLRAAREAKGLTLENVASSIHLRVSQIRAIEEGDISHLPGMAYAVGFVRSYANFLKLNSAEVVARFKADHGGITKIKTELNFPEPMNEAKTPSPLIIGVAAICVVVLLSVWAIFSGGDSDVAEEVPAETAAVIEQPVIDTLPLETEAVTAEGGALAVQPVDGAAIATTDNNTVPAQPAATTAVPAAAETAAAVPAAEPVKPVVKEQAIAPAVKQAAEEPIVVKAPQTRVLLQADETSWVQVTNAKGNVLLKKVMKPGEKFYVPDQKGLSLVTSNAGGVTVIVDGAKTNALGNSGDIVRGVALEPEALKARRKSLIRNY